MAEEKTTPQETDATSDAQEPQLEGGTYEIIRNRLLQHAKALNGRLEQLNAARKEVFGSIETKLLNSDRITTENNCVPRDMITLGNRFIFGYNVFVGLRAETVLEDVFAIYDFKDGQFSRQPLDMLQDPTFIQDFKNLYKYYRETVFVKFAVIGPHLFMAFRVSKDPKDIKTFKWLIKGDQLKYLDARSDHEYVFPPQHQFEWRRVTHEMHRSGQHPHISIEDRVFVETIRGDLTVKIEDNTKSGEGIYAEPVENPDQTLDDAEIFYASIDHLILLKIRPYQEEAYRYLVYNEKVQTVTRIDSIEDACVLLPESHGLIFPKGYYLQTGEMKLFDNDMTEMIFEKRIASPNGEDYLYVFYNRTSGVYVLLSYNMIEQSVSTPMVCNGYSFFDDGTLIFFRSGEEPQRHHAIQIWQTPYCGSDYTFAVEKDSYLYKIGNKDVVRCMAECTEVMILIHKEDSYANLYVDLAKKAQDIRDAYFWLDSPETFNLAEPLAEIQQAAASAIEEFEKVVRAKQNAEKETKKAASRVEELVRAIDYNAMESINDYVKLLAEFRTVRGEVISLKELRYCDLEKIDELDQDVARHTEDLSAACVEYLLKPEALEPYHQRVSEQGEKIPGLRKVMEAKTLSEEVSGTANELEMLTEIVSNLKIEDATQTTAIIDGISLIYQKLNQVKSSLKNRLGELGRTEGQAEFTSQIKLIDQAVANYLDVCDTPEKCDEYLTRVMVQMETLEAKFADFDEFVIELADKREELYGAFESRKVQLVEQRNRRATALMTAAERIIKGIRNRVEAMDDVNAINGYFASDLMIDRLRETIEELQQLGDTVKAEDIRSQLKSIQQDTIRQLKDRQTLYEDGENVIRLGDQKFAVNKQALELTIVNREGSPFFHLTGTGFFDPVRDEDYLATRDVWSMEVVSETPDVYRAEFLAGQMLEDYSALPAAEFEDIAALDEVAVLENVRAFMAPRYAEGYVKGVHDQDAAKILYALLQLKAGIGLLRYASPARALAILAMQCFREDPDFRRLAAEVAGLGKMQGLFDYHGEERSYIKQMQARLAAFLEQHDLFSAQTALAAGEYLFHELATEGDAVMSPEAGELEKQFLDHLKKNDYLKAFEEAQKELLDQPVSRFQLIRKWLRAFVAQSGRPDGRYVDEVTAILLTPEQKRAKVPAEITVELTGLVGSHPRIVDGGYTLDYTDFTERLTNHILNVVPAFTVYQTKKSELIDNFAEQLRLGEFKPRVLTTFVRNKLIDRVYLGLLGDNLAKQIGSAGDSKRTDRQGLLLLISPPGYGKTTLMEYIANRLGLIFMKINGPAIGHRVTSLDPAEAPNAASREEVEKLNLAFEMGDNVMIYVDDIQHCNPEFLQKFISLCDAQRRVEGVFRGQTRTYDLRGKRVCVVMAGNPYTESGEKFRIPDMLSNRADTYNIGDIVGDNYDVFIDSYIENCLTSNPVLAPLANRSQNDVYAVMKLASGQPAESVEFEANYSNDELNEAVKTMKKLFVVRDVVLKVNQQYIRSAAQADEYRTEPPFLLQGSYRNMNRIAQRVVPVMNDQELWTLIQSAYEQDAQTLTSGTESNLLKFGELLGRLDEKQAARWGEIRKTFNRNQLLGDGDDQIAQVIRQLGAFGSSLDTIGQTIAQAAAGKDDANAQAQFEKQREKTLLSAASQLAEKMDAIVQSLNKVSAASGDAPDEQVQQIGQAVLDRLGEVIQAIEKDSRLQHEVAKRHEALTINDSAQTLVSVLEEQFKTLELWLKPVTRTEEGRLQYARDLIRRFEQMAEGYHHLVDVLREKYKKEEAEQAAKSAPAKKTSARKTKGGAKPKS